MRSCVNGIHDLVFTIFLIEKWRQEYNTERPHSSLAYRPPASEAIMPLHFDPFWLSSSKENIGQILT
jgi:hypothetical protein